jgi:hypothetical protein
MKSVFWIHLRRSSSGVDQAEERAFIFPNHLGKKVFPGLAEKSLMSPR